jgi:hypothetical protein
MIRCFYRLPTDCYSVATRFNSPDVLKRSTEAPDLGFRNRRFHRVPFRFKRRPIYEGKTQFFTISTAFTTDEEKRRHSSTISSTRISLSSCENPSKLADATKTRVATVTQRYQPRLNGASKTLSEILRRLFGPSPSRNFSGKISLDAGLPTAALASTWNSSGIRRSLRARS